MTDVKGVARRKARLEAGTLARLALALLVASLSGCRGRTRTVEPVRVPNVGLGPMAIAVAPAINESGSRDFDPVRFADLMASELSYAEGITVIPVSRVLAVLRREGLDVVDSPARAVELARRLGADAMLVFVVTEYDPFEPPVIGIAAQLYGERPGSGHGALDPVALSRQTSLAGAGASAATQRLLASTQRVFDASHQSVVAEIRSFARLRGGDKSPFGWRKFVVSQQDYMRFCSHATIRALLSGAPEAFGEQPEMNGNEGSDGPV